MGSEGLAEAEAAVIGRDLPMNEGSEMAGVELGLCEREEQGVLKDAARKDDGGKSCLFTCRFAGICEELCQRCMKCIGEFADEVFTFSGRDGSIGQRSKAAFCKFGEKIRGGNKEMLGWGWRLLRRRAGDEAGRFFGMDVCPYFSCSLETGRRFSFICAMGAEAEEGAHSVEEAAGTCRGDAVEMMIEEEGLGRKFFFRAEMEEADDFFFQVRHCLTQKRHGDTPRFPRRLVTAGLVKGIDAGKAGVSSKISAQELAAPDGTIRAIAGTVEGKAEDRSGLTVFGKTGEDVGVMMLDWEERDVELVGEFSGEGSGVVARMEVAGNDLGMNGEKAGKEMRAVFKGEDGTQVSRVTDIGRGVKEGASCQRERVFELGTDRERLELMACGGVQAFEVDGEG